MTWSHFCVVISKVINIQPQPKYKTRNFQNKQEKNCQRHSLKRKINWNFKVLLGLNISTIKRLNFLFVFFSISTTTLTCCNKGLNLFDEYAAGCVHLCHQEEQWTSSSWGDNKTYLPGAIANSQMMPTKINKKGAIDKVRILGEQLILWGN